MLHASLSYPLAAPEKGHLVTVAPGVHWIRLPMPFRLDHINVWALEDGDGWTLVDTGVRTEETVVAWEALMAKPPLDRPLKRIIVTHMHPDHIGMAGWLARKFGVRLWMSRLEYLACRVLVGDTGREAPSDAIRFLQEAGWSAAAVDGYRARFGNFGKSIHALPDSYHRIRDHDRFRIGEHEWEVVAGSGHSPEHSCLYCPELKVLISGDQVLPKISSNVSVHAIEPDANPMGDWYASFDTIKSRVPDDVLVLPAHNDVFHGLHFRIEQLREGQDAALARLRELLREPKRVVDVFPALFRTVIKESDVAVLGMATGEAIACLNYLMERGEVKKRVDAGIAWYSLA
ncbi:MBL fold metallo-hydrolase [Ramlibacter sp. G-1-2-2]|uniref:MBL fold metallo-hydrolase n=1 Tax=Ramlibacter agri TaxID=2728837 RepID=A0A848H747_9BURK|nr:MBL fold metallo-hydrolase [Ramlibacter agri]NML44373.1 MBL fold metallo-hydrolase [Ramlibacter agri]